MDRWKVFILLLMSCTLSDCAATDTELEEFSDFLEKTSLLDLTLKDGFKHDNENDDEATDNAWEESGRFEGDIILNARQRKVLVEDVAEGLSRNGLRDTTKRWPNNEVIYYIQREHFTEGQISAIKEGIDDVARSSCVTFRPYRKGDRDAVVVQGNRRGCFSQVGYQGGYQVLNLSRRHPVSRGCFRHGTIVHEFLHALGFYHMQSSPDRDDYVDIKWENIIEPARHNFRKYNTFAVSDFGVGYDYDSVLHYSRRAFSSNGQDTIVPKDAGASIGQRTGMSQKDADKLSKMYCDANSNDSADEEETTKPPLKKKNKPFEGRGLGYHQGKAVAIVLPAAKTVQLRYSPMYQLFDHFSQSPQALSPTQNKGFGEGLSYPKYVPIYVSDLRSYQIHEHPIFLRPNTKEDSKPAKKQDDSLMKEKDNDTNVKTPDQSHNTNLSDKPDHILDEAFKRLEKIIHTHVYPSQPTHLKPYIDKLKAENYFKPKEIDTNVKIKLPTLDKKSILSDLYEVEKSYSFDMKQEGENVHNNPHDEFKLDKEKVINMENLEKVNYSSETTENYESITKVNDYKPNLSIENDSKEMEKSNEIEPFLGDSVASQYETDFDKRLAAILESYTDFDKFDFKIPDMSEFQIFSSNNPQISHESEGSETRRNYGNIYEVGTYVHPSENRLSKKYKSHFYPRFKYFKDWLNK